MIINGKSINGLYKYNPLMKYDKGDLVIYNSIIYVAQDSVNGENPTVSEKYKVYLGDKYVSYNDYINSDITENDDRYIPLKLFPAILNRYMNGVNNKGVLTNLSDSDNGERILDTILYDDNIDYATYSVSRNLKELESINLMPNDSGNFIMKQYTYIDDGNKIRTQELVDHFSGIIWYRWYNLSSLNYNPSDWVNVCVNIPEANRKIKELINTYTSLINNINNLSNDLKGKFRFSPIVILSPTSKLVVPEEYSNSVITIGISTKLDEDFYYKNSLTIDLSSSSLKKFKVFVKTFELSKNIKVLIDDSSSEKVIKLLNDDDTEITDNSSIIDNSYINEYYK